MADKKRFPSDKLDQYIVRFPEGMKDEIRTYADLYGRSMNAEIVQRLKASFSRVDDDRPSVPISKHHYEKLYEDASIQDKKIGQLLEEILSGTYSSNQYEEDTNERIQEERLKNTYLIEDIERLKDIIYRDFVLYYTKATQLRDFTSMILDSEDVIIPEKARAAAESLRSLTEIETGLFRERFENGLDWVKRQDIRDANKLAAGSDGKYGWDFDGE